MKLERICTLVCRVLDNCRCHYLKCPGLIVIEWQIVEMNIFLTGRFTNINGEKFFLPLSLIDEIGADLNPGLSHFGQI